MREAIREVERTIEEVRTEHSAATVRQHQSARQARLFRDRLTDLDQKALFALAEGREDLAEAAISRQIDFEAQAALLEQAGSEAKAEASQLDGSLAALQARKRQMEEDLAAVEAMQGAADGGRATASGLSTNAGRRVEQAEGAFRRALSGLGGDGCPGSGDPQASAKVAEIDTLQRQVMITQRIAKLRGAPVAL